MADDDGHRESAPEGDGHRESGFDVAGMPHEADGAAPAGDGLEGPGATADAGPEPDHGRRRAPTGTGDDLEARMREAVDAVRQEGYKTALLYAVADGALALVVVGLAVRVLDAGTVPETVPLPGVVAGVAGVSSLTTAALASVVAGLLVGAVEFGLRVRRPLVEQFEHANPSVHEALRTARDAVEDGRNSRMALRLYEDVLDRLRETSSVGLVDLRRLTLTVLLVVGVGLAGVQLAVLDVEVSPLPGGGDGPGDGQQPGGATGNGTPAEFEGLKDGSAVLGDPEDVTAGDNPQNASIDPTQAGGDRPGPPPSSYDESGLSTGVESQRAGYASEERPEDADLIRDYNLAIREDDDDG